MTLLHSSHAIKGGRLFPDTTDAAFPLRTAEHSPTRHHASCEYLSLSLSGKYRVSPWHT
ncbi:hypothetical protein E2C01_081262 [Portunus trituberculatus]|uniref:Uncharacterized protein n=1 Tax=Portunus trituberculatus TaxID=210409 RepID=A0A5B7J1T9_PORTR|nr:hypothetical protein [Portunus trituberculatus]